MAKTDDALPPRDQIALVVGRIANEAAWLEYYASLLASTLIGTERADPFTFGHNWTAIADGLDALLRCRIEGAAEYAAGADVAFFEATRTHLKEARKLMIKRNDVVHALWSLPNELGARDAITQKRFKAAKVETWTLDELRSLRQHINFRTLALSQAVERLAGPEE